jgi:putative restriction endonuclease
VKFWVGVTDNTWFAFLARLRPDEVNFWHPGGRPPFTHLEPGAPFLFKLKRPHNHVAGGGHFVKYSKLPLSMVWEAFGEKNGAATRGDFERIIRPLMPDPAAKDPDVGCTVLTMPWFLDRHEWIEFSEWPRSNVRGGYYDSGTSPGAELWERVSARPSPALAVADAPLEPTARYGDAQWVSPRLGQGAFRVVVTDAYKRRCAITGESTLPVLEAAHIVPYSEDGPHLVSNGLLLRSDFHKLFDRGLVTVTPDLRVRVSSKIKESWFNGKAYYRLDGQPLAVLPDAVRERPNPEFLKWHNERFEG